ncbi:MAG TPA: YlxR family protein [Candidatus Anaerostipes excrementavium]|uniref:YlxR family protein n=1 Tax=Candidatus Anaerostipes excrementavium TaxID=2838463 RepID=A0A9D2B896_9FIRM|nr:YlxR family protein [uncultured Anaerostipes sp.]HIX66701.1 YlxR family protein [Candidatus Anaerostipes excrementavium]
MSNRKIPTRKCIGCGEQKPKRDLVRIVRSKEGDISMDMTGKKNGRGAYICRSEDCLKKAIRSKGLERSFKMAIPEEIYEQLKKEMNELA